MGIGGGQKKVCFKPSPNGGEGVVCIWVWLSKFLGLALCWHRKHAAAAARTKRMSRRFLFTLLCGTGREKNGAHSLWIMWELLVTPRGAHWIWIPARGSVNFNLRIREFETSQKKSDPHQKTHVKWKNLSRWENSGLRSDRQ